MTINFSVTIVGAAAQRGEFHVKTIPEGAATHIVAAFDPSIESKPEVTSHHNTNDNMLIR
jgi:hypothetical protein